MSLHEEASWAVEEVKSLGLLDVEDSAVLFQSFDALQRSLSHLSEAFNHPRALHAVAIKTNPHPGILKRVVSWGFGLEAASYEEVQLAVDAGCPADRIVFDSPVKRLAEIKACHEKHAGIRFNVNSLEELLRLPEVPSFPVGIRVNPMVETGAPTAFNVSHDESKFGVPIQERAAILDAILRFPVVQLHVHSGSSMSNLDSAVAAVASLVGLAQEANTLLESRGFDRRITTLDIGGGLLPEVLTEGVASQMHHYVSGLRAACPDLWNFELITEFGQWLYFYTGYAVSDVEYAVQRGATRVVYIHVGADFLLRDAYVKSRGIDFIPVGEAALRAEVLTDIAGPLCFAGDYLKKGEALPALQEGDQLLLLNTGSNAYGLWSRHCSRTIPKVIGVDYASRQVKCLSKRFNPFLRPDLVD